MGWLDPITWDSLDKPDNVVAMQPHEGCICGLERWEFPDGSALVKSHGLLWGIGHPKGADNLYEVVSPCIDLDRIYPELGRE